MKQIYDFEQYSLPALRTHHIKEIAEKQKMNKQMTILILASILIQAIVIFIGVEALDWYPIVSVLCFGYVGVTAAGSGVFAVSFSKKGGITL